MKRILIRSIVIADIKMLLPLVRMYWSFEKISDFEDEPVSKQLTYLFSNPHLGMGWMHWQKKYR